MLYKLSPKHLIIACALLGCNLLPASLDEAKQAFEETKRLTQQALDLATQFKQENKALQEGRQVIEQRFTEQAKLLEEHNHCLENIGRLQVENGLLRQGLADIFASTEVSGGDDSDEVVTLDEKVSPSKPLAVAAVDLKDPAVLQKIVARLKAVRAKELEKNVKLRTIIKQISIEKNALAQQMDQVLRFGLDKEDGEQKKFENARAMFVHLQQRQRDEINNVKAEKDAEIGLLKLELQRLKSGLPLADDAMAEKDAKLLTTTKQNLQLKQQVSELRQNAEKHEQEFAKLYERLVKTTESLAPISAELEKFKEAGSNTEKAAKVLEKIRLAVQQFKEDGNAQQALQTLQSLFVQEE